MNCQEMTQEIRLAIDRYRILCNVQAREQAGDDEEAKVLFLAYDDALDALKGALRAIRKIPLDEVGELLAKALNALDAWEAEIAEMVRCVTRRDDPMAVIEEGAEMIRKMKETRVGADPGVVFFKTLDALAERVPPLGGQA